MNTPTDTPRFLFLLDRIEDPVLEPGDTDPWPEYMGDANSAMLVCAENEQHARQLAGKSAMDEGSRVWVNPRFTTCVSLAQTTQPVGVVLRGETPQTL